MKPQSASEQKISIQDIRGPVVRRVRRGRGRPRKGHEKNPLLLPKSRKSWSRKTEAYVKMVTEGKGAPCKIWSRREKKQLLLGLQKHSHQDWDSLCKLIPSRSKEEIQEYIHNLKGGEQSKTKTKEGYDVHLAWAPIESWLDMSSEMVHYEQADLSNILSRVFSIIGHFGSFPQVNNSSGLVPDFGKLYRYIAAIMDESLSMPELSALESAIIADLMHDLGDLLRVSDTSLQRKVMCWKYKMLNYKFEFDDVRGSLDRIRKALTNDFSDLQRDSDRGVSGLPSFTQTSSGAAGRGTSTAPVTQSRVSNRSSSTVTSPEASTVSGAESSSAPQPRETSSNTSASAPVPSTSTSSPQPTNSANAEKPKRGRGRPRIHDWRRPIEKPRLFTMNPFCVPIRLLRLKSLLGEETTRNTASARTVRQRSVSVCSVHSDSSDTGGHPASSGSHPTSGGSHPTSSGSHPASRRLSIEVESSQAEVTNNIRQVTGLYVPKVARKNKKRISPPQTQVSASTMKAISSALARRNEEKNQEGNQEKNQEKETTRPREPPPPPPRVVQVASKGTDTAVIPSQAFRCIRLHDGKTALVPLHLSDAATLSQLKIKEAMPVPKRMPPLTAGPGVQGQAPAEGNAGMATPLSAPGTTGVVLTDMSRSVEQISRSALAPVQPQHTTVTVATLPPSVSASAQQTSGPAVVRPLVAVRQSSGASVSNSIGCPPSLMELEQPDGSVVTQIAQIVPKKRKQFVKPILPKASATTEIVVGPPPGMQQTTVVTSKAPPSKHRPGKQSKPSQPKSGKGPVPKKKGKTSQSERSTTASKPEKTHPVGASKSRAVTKGKAAGAKRRKASGPKDGVNGTLVQSSDSPGGSQQPRPSENGQVGTLSDDSSPRVNISGPLKTYNRVPNPAVTKVNFVQAKSKPSTVAASTHTQSAGTHCIGQNIQVVDTSGSGLYFGISNLTAQQAGGRSSENSDQHGNVSRTATTETRHQASGSQSHQNQLHITAPTHPPPTPDQAKNARSSFKSILAQVASSPHVPPANSTSNSTKTVSFNSPTQSGQKTSFTSQTSSDPTVPSSSSSLPSPSPSTSRVRNPPKKFLSTQEPQTKPQPLQPTPQPPASRRGRKRKTVDGVKDVRGKPRKATKLIKLNAPSQGGKANGGAAASDASKKAKKRPANFLASEDISKMQVEIVTPEDVRGRLLASAGTGLDSRAHMKKKLAEAQKLCGEKPLSVVVDDDEISLVSI